MDEVCICGYLKRIEDGQLCATCTTDALFEAVRSGDCNTIRTIANSKIVNVVRKDTEGTALHVAITEVKGDAMAAVVRALVLAGADVNAPHPADKRRTPMHYAAIYGAYGVVGALCAKEGRLKATLLDEDNKLPTDYTTTPEEYAALLGGMI